MLSARDAYSLPELMVAIVISGVIAAAVMDAVIRQQRFYAAAARIADVRAAVRQGAEILSSELRAITPTEGDLASLGNDHVDFRRMIGASVLCVIAPSRAAAVLPPTRAASPLGLTAWVAAPSVGDTLLVLDAGAPGAADDRWDRHVLADDPARGAVCPTTSGFTSTNAESAAGWAIRVTPPFASGVLPGAAVRFVRRARFELYRASDGRWFLGYIDCVSSRAIPCAVVQPVSGPYDPLGVRFAAFDTLGASVGPTDAATGVSAFVIDLRASARGLGPVDPPWRDSARVVVTVRH